VTALLEYIDLLVQLASSINFDAVFLHEFSFNTAIFKQYVTEFWKISPNVTFDNPNIYSQNEASELPINCTVIKICNSHVELLELKVKYFKSSANIVLVTQ